MTHIQNPMLKHKYRVYRINSRETMVLTHDSGDFLKSAYYAEALELLSEKHCSVEYLITHFQGRLFPHQVFEIIRKLDEMCYITEHYDSGILAHPEFWESLDMDPVVIAQTLAEKTVSIRYVGNLDGGHFEEVCSGLSIQLDSSGDFWVVIADAYDNPELGKINSEATKSGTPWMLIGPTGTSPMIGPVFIPSKTACWSCLEHRLSLNQPHKRYYQQVTDQEDFPTPPMIVHPLVMQQVYAQAGIELVRVLLGASALEGHILTYSHKTQESTKHRLVRRPQCQVCGDRNRSVPARVHLDLDDYPSNYKYREVGPDITFERYKHHISKLTGILSGINRYSNVESSLIHNYTSGRNLISEGRILNGGDQHFRAYNAGKGSSAEQAKTSALCEAIERYCMFYQGQDHGIKGSLSELPHAIHPNDCMNFSEKQYEQRSKINKERKFYTLVPRPFDDELTFSWVPVHSIISEKLFHLPAFLCYANYPIEHGDEPFAYPDSNGCSAGNTLPEAILYGIFELVERDAAAIWWYNRLKRETVDLNTVPNDYVQNLKKAYDAMGRSLVVQELTTDLGIPVFAAISYLEKDTGGQDIVFAFGAHVDALIAIERALTELNQVLDGSRMTKHSDKTRYTWLKEVRISEQTFMTSNPGAVKAFPNDYPTLCSKSTKGALDYCIAQFKAQNIDILVLDLTQPDIELPVVKVFAPGLRHFWRREAPGRLFEVPVKQGWLKSANTDEDLNPWTIFL